MVGCAVLQLPGRLKAAAVASAALAGFVDGAAFLQLGGFFVSFMSGNSTRAGVGIASGSAHAAIAIGLIAAFVAGVAAGSTAARRGAGPGLRMALVTGTLVLTALLSTPGWSLAGGLGLALAMGAMNTVFEENGENRFGVTYMTGALVRVGQRLAGAAAGEPALAWLPYLLLWAALVAGAAAGAALFHLWGAGALWIATAAAAMLTYALRADHRQG